MNPQRIFGLVLVALGVLLLIIGMSSSDSMVDQFSKTLTGRFTDRTQWYIVGGIVMGIAGVALTLFGPRGRRI